MNSKNITINNQTFISEKCLLTLTLPDPYNITLTALRFLVIFLYCAWLILSIKVKEFHNKHLVYLHNVNAAGLFFCIQAFALLFSNTCDVYSQEVCLIQSIIITVANTLSGYALAALALHRLSCVYILNLDKKLNRKWITITIFLIWFLPLFFTIILLYGFKSTKVYFAKFIPGCIYTAPDDIGWFCLYLVVNVVIPNIITFVSYLWGLFRIKKLQASTSSSAHKNPPRITIQLIIYVLMFELNCAASAIITYQSVIMRPIVSNDVIILMRIFKWFHHFSPLALLYFHPVMLKKYKMLWCKETPSSNHPSDQRNK